MTVWHKLFFVVIGVALYVYTSFLGCNVVQEEDNTQKEEIVEDTFDTIVIEEIVEPVQERIVKKKAEFVKYEHAIEYVDTKIMTVTYYHKGKKYGNDDITDLPLQERRVQRFHRTVALNKKMRDMHTAVIQVEDRFGRYVFTHKYRFHVPGYNKLDKSTWDSSYYSVPRDVMSHKAKLTAEGKCLYCEQDRIDILFTTAGNYATIEQRGAYWGMQELPVEIYEICRYAVYSDGTRRRVE